MATRATHEYAIYACSLALIAKLKKELILFALGRHKQFVASLRLRPWHAPVTTLVPLLHDQYQAFT